MTIESLVKAIHEMRQFTLRSIDGLRDAMLLEIPEGASNCILWNVGHILFDQCNELYKPSGLALPVPETYEGWFKSGSSPGGWRETPDWLEVLGLFKTLNDRIVKDLEGGAFSGFQPYKLDDDTPVDTIEESVLFDLMHQGVHTGVILTLRKLLESRSG